MRSVFVVGLVVAPGLLVACISTESSSGNPNASSASSSSGASSSASSGSAGSPGTSSSSTSSASGGPDASIVGFAMDFTSVTGGALLTSTSPVLTTGVSGVCQLGSCSFSSGVSLSGGCYGVLAVAVGSETPTVGMSFAIETGIPTPAGKALVRYEETCSGATRRWAGGSGSVRIDRIQAPPAGLTMGKMAVTVTGAQMAATIDGASTATGQFVANGTGTDLPYSATPH